MIFIRDIKIRILYFILILFFLFSCGEGEDKNSLNNNSTNDGILLIDGERVFITGTYHHPKTENPFEELRDNGYNYVRVNPFKDELDSAFKYNLKTWLVTGTIKDHKKEDISRITDLVNKFKDHKSLLFWEMEDEPAFTWNSAEARVKPEPMLETYQLIKGIDSSHLVITNHGPVNLISTLQKYNNSTDVVACDVYPVIPAGIKPTYALFPDGLQGDLLNPYISQVGEYTDKMKKVVSNSKPVFMVLQGFAWEMLKPAGERDLSKIKFPSYRECRFMAYNAIVHGAAGLLYWGTAYTPQPSQFMDDLNNVTREIADMRKIISGMNIQRTIEIEYHELGYSVDAGIEWILKRNNSKYYLITTNSDRKPSQVTFKGFSDFKKVSVLFENRFIKITDGNFRDYYKEFDVHLYEIE